MKSNTSGRVRSIFVHLVLIFLSFLCLFFFYILIVNATRSHADLQPVSYTHLRAHET